MDNNIPLYGTVSYCHKSPSLIVRSRKQGFVTQNCLECGEPRSLPFDDLPNLSCEGCDLELKRFINDRKNYAYACDRCGIGFELASLVPHWNERFEYHGFALDSDYLFAHGLAPSVIYLNVNGTLKETFFEESLTHARGRINRWTRAAGACFAN